MSKSTLQKLDAVEARQNRKKRQTQHGQTQKSRVLTHANASSCGVTKNICKKVLNSEAAWLMMCGVEREDPHDRNHKQHDTMTSTIKPRWIIDDAIHGECTIDPRSIRYYRNERHAYGWQLGFEAKVILADGSRKKRTFSALGTNRRAAMANALPR